MRDIFLFAVGASVLGTVFLVSSLELFYTIRRRRVYFELEEKMKALREQYNQQINQVVLDDEAKLEAAEQQLKEQTEAVAQERVALEAEYQGKLDAITATSGRAVLSARKHAKAMEAKARLQADEYLANRKREVEKELMALVLAVSKKVLPEGISYDAHKELVMRALRDIEADRAKTE